jgi:hypothetical protein
MLFGDTNELDIDGRNCNGDMRGANDWDIWVDYDDPTPKTAPVKKYQFNSLAEMLQSEEVMDLVRKTIAHKDRQIRDLQNELLRISEQEN